MKKIKIVSLIIILLTPNIVLAHPGRTDQNGCHYCRTNCEKYGLNYGEYHCHNGNSTSSNSATNNNSSSINNYSESNSSIKEEVKSNDNFLKNIIIDGETLEVTENINYSTKKENIEIEAETNNDKATYKIKNNSTLKIGNNEIIIEVTAEDGSIKNYKINVNRKKLSSDTGIKVIVDDSEVSFSNYKATIYVDSSATNISLDYELNNSNSIAQIEEIEELKIGDNELNIKVIAEDGTEQIYEIIIHKSSKFENFISTIASLWFLGCMGYGIYFIIKKIKENK